jgi:hypothetical protein
MDTCDIEVDIALLKNIKNFINRFDYLSYYNFIIEYIINIPFELLYFITFISLTVLILLTITIIKTQHTIIINEKKYLENFKYLLEKNNIENIEENNEKLLENPEINILLQKHLKNITN